jgi:hypothetical protein
MALRYRAQFKSERSQVWTLQIYDADYSGSVGTLQVAPPGFSLTWAGGEDIFHPVIPSTATVPVYLENATHATLFEDLATANEGRFRLVIRKGDGDSAPLWWAGLITVDNITQSDQPFPQAVEIKAVDGLQLLSRVTYDNQDGGPSISEVLLYSLKQIGTSDLFVTDGSAVPLLRVLGDIEPDEATFNDTFNDVKLKPLTWNVETQEYDSEISTETVLTQLARALNSRLFMCEGMFQFHSVSKPLNVLSNYNTRTYLEDGTESTAVSTTFVHTIGSTSNLIPLSGFERRMVVPVSKVVRPLVYGEGTLIDNTASGGVALVPSGAASGTSEVTYTVSSENVFPAGTTFTLTGTCRVDAEYLAGSTGLHQIGRLRLGIKLRVDTYYLERTIELDANETITVDADAFNIATSDETVHVWTEPNTAQWTTSNTDRLHFGADYLNYDKKLPNFVTGQDDSTTFSLNITTPGLPAESDVDVELVAVGVLYNSNTGAANQAKLDATTIDLVLSLQTGEGLNGSSVIYTATNDNDATEVRQEDAATFGSQLVFSNVYLYNPAEFYNVNGGLPDWVSDGYTTAQELHELCVQQIAQYMNDPREIQSGAVFSQNGSGLPFYSYVFHSDRLTWYMLVSMTMQANEDTYEIELHELSDTSSNPAPVTDIVKPKPSKPIPAVGQFDSLQKQLGREIRSTSKLIDDVQLSLASIERTTDGGGGLSSILLQYLGDVKISGPTHGQVLEYNSAAGRWANVTLTGGGAPQAVIYGRMSMSSDVLRGGTNQQDFTGITDVTVKFDTVDDNDGGELTINTTTHRMTVETAGLYRLTVNMSFHSFSTRATPAVRFNVNGSSIDGESMGYIRNTTGVNEATGNLTRVVLLAASDYVEVCCHDESTATGSIYAEEAIFEIEKLGGIKGDPGADGADGVDGVNGVDGAPGADGADGADGLGFTGGSYDAGTGVVTFTSDDGLGFATGDLRGADGADAPSNFADLDDVNPSLSPAPGDLLLWTTVNGGQWNSTTPALAVGSSINMGNLGNVSDSTGTAGNILVDYNLSGPYWISVPASTWAGTYLALQHLGNVSGTTPSTGDLLQWNGTQWAPYTPPAAVSYFTIQSSFYTGDGNGDYIPIGGTLSETTSSQYYNRWTAPMSGEVVSARVFTTSSSAGSSTISISKYPIPSTIDSDTQTISTANNDVEFTFDTATFVAGDQLRFWFDPTGSPAGVSITILIKLTHP